MADVGQAGGAEQCITDRVGEAVGVAVAVEAEVGVELHAAEHERPARDEAVDIVAVADAEIHGSRLPTEHMEGTEKKPLTLRRVRPLRARGETPDRRDRRAW